MESCFQGRLVFGLIKKHLAIRLPNSRPHWGLRGDGRVPSVFKAAARRISREAQLSQGVGAEPATRGHPRNPVNFADSQEATLGPVSGQTEHTRVGQAPLSGQILPAEQTSGAGAGRASWGQTRPAVGCHRTPVCSPPHAAVLFLADLLEGQIRACCAKKLLVTPWVLMNPSIVKYTEGAVTSNVRHM